MPPLWAWGMPRALYAAPLTPPSPSPLKPLTLPTPSPLTSQPPSPLTPPPRSPLTPLCCSIGLQSGQGLSLVGYNSATLVTLGGCPLENRVYQYSIANSTAEAVCKADPDTGALSADLGPPSSSFMCKVGASATVCDQLFDHV